jgi:hypothetical protein
MPDKPSPYWLDYLIDETPHNITDPGELMRYYEQFYNKLPRLEALSRPKTVYSSPPLTKPLTVGEYGIYEYS